MFTQTTFPILLGAVVLGVAAASFYSYYTRTVLGSLVRALLDAAAVGEKQATPLADLDVKRPARLRRAMRGPLARVVGVTPAPKPASRRLGTLQDRFEIETARFFIPEAAEAKARGSYGKHVETILTPILTTLFFAVLAVLVYLFLPNFVEIPM